MNPTCSLMNRTLPSANRKLAPPGCRAQYWSPWARPEGELGPCPSPECETPRPASLRVQAGLGLECDRGTAAFVMASRLRARGSGSVRRKGRSGWCRL